jgi:hypothetical protein
MPGSSSELTELVGAEREGRPFLVFREEQQRLCVFPVGSDGPALTVGRGPEMGISIF